MGRVTKEEFMKMTIGLKYWFLGKGYYRAAKALDFAKGYHKGTRKDKVTPEFEHQVSMACYARAISACFLHPEDTFIAILLHDVSEDYNVPLDTYAPMFGESIPNIVGLLTKKFRGESKDIKTYYGDLALDPVGSLAKGVDRVHNISTMCGVFSVEKQLDYIRETEELVLPMIKKARNMFPEQETAYECIKLSLKTSISIIRSLLNSEKTN